MRIYFDFDFRLGEKTQTRNLSIPVRNGNNGENPVPGSTQPVGGPGSFGFEFSGIV